jgi:sugar lactone lactonase YvrE
MIWPDTMSLAVDGHLYFTANQLNRQARFHDGKDLRQKRYLLLRIKTDGKPAM